MTIGSKYKTMVTKRKDYNLLREVKNKKEKSPLFHTLKFLVLYIIREQSKNGPPPPPALNSWRATLKEKKKNSRKMIV